jgi:hypothetical protein
VSYRSAAEVRMTPVAAAFSARYAIKLERIHAVQVIAGVPQEHAVCGWRVDDTFVEPQHLWRKTPTQVRCQNCATGLDV